MTSKLREAQKAFELWEMLIKMDNMLWDRYENEFQDFVMDKVEKEDFKNYTVDDEDIYPF